MLNAIITLMAGLELIPFQPKDFLMHFLSRLIVLICLTCPQVLMGQEIHLDQQPDVFAFPQVIDQEIPDVDEFSTFVLSDVTFNTTSSIGEITVYFTNGFFSPWQSGALTEARVSIVTDPFGTYDPRLDGLVVPVTVTQLANNLLAITVFGMDRRVPPGTYWIGVHPIVRNDLPQEFHYAALKSVGSNSLARNPGGGFDIGTQWQDAGILSPGFVDGAITIRDGFPLTPPVLPDSLNVLRGNVVAGTFAELIAETNPISFQPGFVLNSKEAPVWLEFQGTIFDSFVPRSVVFESTAGTPGLTYTIEQWNWNTSSYEVIDEDSESFNEPTVKKIPIDANVNNANQVRLRIGWRQTGFTINFPWQVNLDRIAWMYSS